MCTVYVDHIMTPEKIEYCRATLFRVLAWSLSLSIPTHSLSTPTLTLSHPLNVHMEEAGHYLLPRCKSTGTRLQAML